MNIKQTFNSTLWVLLLILSVAQLSKAQKPELVVQTGHSGWIHTVAFSPDGKIFASGSSDQTVRLWNVTNGAELRTLKGHTYNVLSIAFDPTGILLASGGGDNMVKLWDVMTGELRLTLRSHSSSVTSVAFSPDGRILASGSSDGLIKLWSLPSGRELRSLANMIETRRPGELHPPNVNSIAFSPDGKLLISGGIEHSVKLWDVNTGEVIHSMKDTAYDVNTVAFSRDGQTAFSASAGEITAWDVHTGQEMRRLPAPAGRIDMFAFSPDGGALAIANYSGTISLRDLKSGVEKTLKGHQGDVLTVAFSPDGQMLVSGSSDRTIKLWNLNTGVVERTFEGHSGGIFTDQFSGDKIILAGSTDRTVKLWDLSSRDALLRTIARHDSEFLSLTFSPNGQYVVTSGANDPVRIWDVATGSELRRLPWLSVKSDAPVPKAFSRDGKILAGEDNNHHIELYDAASGVKLRTIETHGGGVYSIAFSLDGKILAVGGFKEVTLWDVASGRELLTLAGHANIVHAIVFSPDGKTLATDNLNQLFLWDVSTGTKLQTLKGGGGENFIFSPDSKTIFGSIVKFIDKVMMTGVMQWDVRTGAELRSFQGHSAGVNNIAFSPDAKTMATSSIDNSVKLWDLNTGKELHTLNGHSGQVLSVAFSADGRLLISSSDDLTIKIWTATSGEELATLIALDDQDWAVITPDGLFDGSPPAWDRIAWRYERKPFEVIVTPVEAYFTEFYYPGLLADIIAGKRPRAETNLESKDRRQLPVKLTVAEKTDPQTPVSSRTIRLRIEVEEAPKVLTSRVWWEAGARDVRLFRNGSLVKFWQGDLFDLTKKEGCILQPRQTGSEPQRSICTATVPIVAGPNNFTAYAFNHDNIKSEDATLTVTGADSLKHKGTLHILAVGVSQYANQEYNLNYTTDDATSFATQLKLEQEKQSRYQSVETKTLLNQNATKENILAELRKLAASVQPEDAVVVYFSGHGKASGDHFYLVPHDLGYDGSRDQLSAEGLKLILAHSISDLELEEVFRGIDAGQMFMIIDACNSGQALENKDEPRRGPMNTRGLAQLAYEKGMYIMTASQNVEEAFVSEKLKHSYLTFALVEEGLKTKAADANHNGEVTLREWFDYALARVPKLREEVLQTKSLEEVTPKMKAARSQKSQTPRVFYRRELDSNPLVVAVFATTAPQ